MRLIDADALIKEDWFVEYRPYDWSNVKQSDELVEQIIRQCKGIVNDAPTVEVKTVKHGKWGHMQHDTITTMMYLAKCNLCGFWAYAPALYENSQFLDFCPNCGAKMDGGAE